MNDLTSKYWNERLIKCAAAFRCNGFNVVIVEKVKEVSGAILPEDTIHFGGEVGILCRFAYARSNRNT